MTVPRATMRLQFHRGFTFDDAIAIVPYLDALNISHLYASPILKARTGSLHGYDVVDPTQLNPELGGEPAFRRLVAALRARGLGIIVDIVPHHMAIGAENPWWLDVLRLGHESRFAAFFDIDWEAEDPGLRGKILVPILGKPYGEALDSGEIELAFNEALGRYEARYFDHILPLSPNSRVERLDAYDAATAAGRRRLHDLLEQQNFRLAFWRIANDAINWRRFFDINELIALRAEDDSVFEAVHAKLFELFAEGLIDGLRIDHIDGLADPAAYCRRLRDRLETLESRRPAGSDRGPAYIVVEKILGTGEELPSDWACDGTSGYDFLDQISSLLHDADGAEPLAQLWKNVSGRPADFGAEEELARREVLIQSFSAQLSAAVGAIYRFAEANLDTRDVARPAIQRALAEILAHLRIYRTYPNATVSAQDCFNRAVDGALRASPPADRDVVRQLALWLCAKESGNLHKEAIRHFQQLSAPLAAKAVEDTALYRYGRLLSRNDVGCDPARFAEDVAAFHKQNDRRAAVFPQAMLATATHDHKRGEDVRARLAVLSEIPEIWAETLDQWLAEAASLFTQIEGKPAPSYGDAAILFQMLVGAWPADLSAEDETGCAAFADRIGAWQQKALREAKLATSWLMPNEPYESAARKFLMRIFAPAWAVKISAFAQRIAAAGAVNGLAQTLLKLTVPGVPDIYQGCEFWDMSLVDPDNRRAVDFDARSKALDRDEPIATLAARWRDGRIKQRIIRQVLAVRRALPQLFAEGTYRTVTVEGHAARQVCAFVRQNRGAGALIVASRLCARQLDEASILVPTERWGETRLRLPPDFEAAEFREQLTGRLIKSAPSLPISAILDRLPVALLVALPG